MMYVCHVYAMLWDLSICLFTLENFEKPCVSYVLCGNVYKCQKSRRVWISNVECIDGQVSTVHGREKRRSDLENRVIQPHGCYECHECFEAISRNVCFIFSLINYQS